MDATDGGYLRTLFLHPPSYDGFDGGAGSRYQARREIRSFWYPTWLAQPAALVPGSRLIDAPPEGLKVDDVRSVARDYELAVLHTSTPSFAHDVEVAEALKRENPRLRIGFVGAHVAVNPTAALWRSPAIEFVTRNEFDFTIQEVAEGRPLDTILGLSHRANGTVRHTPDRPVLENMDALPFVVDVYKRDLVIEHYAIGYLLHPYLSLYTGRGCRSRCTFCLWPQTVGGHRYRTRSVDHVVSEIATAMRYFPQVQEYFFDDDTLTDDLPRAEALARRLGKLGVTWSCNAKANVPYETLKVLKDGGLRLLLVGYESGDQQILNMVRKGVRLDMARRFTRDAKALGIKIHGTFILGLPGETAETIERTIQFAQAIDPDTVQVSIAAPYPGTELYRQAAANGWLAGEALVDARGAQVSALSYPHLASTEIARSTEEFYRRFYFRPRKIFAIAGDMLADRRVLRRRLVEGREFLGFLAARRRAAAADSGVGASLRQPGDGYLARLDRSLSIAISRRLARTAVTPNAITAASLIVGLAGAMLLALGARAEALVGTLLLWASCILDGCDGEVARLTMRASPRGARFDAASDTIVHLATFAAILVHLHRTRPDLAIVGPGVMLLGGVGLSMLAVWWLINRHPPARRAPRTRIYERLASRDYVYVLVPLTAVGQLQWFVWSAAVGANVFWLSLSSSAWLRRAR